ncbi:MAG: hypothetical protein SFU56_17015 [Capsulimonadales bacterium]|nr:hypothetical protein [Capsulimonadales bacterium]
MRLLNALVVDEIRDTDAGTVDLVGLREDLFFDALPVLLERLTLFMEWEIAPDDRGRRQSFLLRLSDTSQKVLKEVPISFTIPEDYARPVAPLDPTLFEVPFERWGWHYLDVFTPEEHVRRLYLHVLPRENDP